MRFTDFVSAFNEKQAEDRDRLDSIFMHQLIHKRGGSPVQGSFLFNYGDCTPGVSGANDQQLQREAFILKDETDKEQTLHINVQ